MLRVWRKLHHGQRVLQKPASRCVSRLPVGPEYALSYPGHYESSQGVSRCLPIQPTAKRFDFSLRQADTLSPNDVLDPHSDCNCQLKVNGFNLLLTMTRRISPPCCCCPLCFQDFSQMTKLLKHFFCSSHHSNQTNHTLAIHNILFNLHHDDKKVSKYKITSNILLHPGVEREEQRNRLSCISTKPSLSENLLCLLSSSYQKGIYCT